jgi:hypothetical protein
MSLDPDGIAAAAGTAAAVFEPDQISLDHVAQVLT